MQVSVKCVLLVKEMYKQSFEVSAFINAVWFRIMCLHLTLLVLMPFLFQFLTSYLTVGQVLILPDTNCHETSCMM